MMDHEKANERYGSVRYQSAVGTAIVAGVFAALIAVLLGIHLYHYHVTDPAGAVTLEKMKEQAKLYPADQTLSQEILMLDTQLRRDQLARLAFLKRGTLLLAGALAIGIGSLVWAMGYHAKPPSPVLPTDVKAEQINTARRIRTALTAALAALAAGSLFWSLYTPKVQPPAEPGPKTETVAKEEPKPEDIAYASMDQMEAQWPTFRGPGGLGVCRFGAIPTEWDAAGGKNILWKTPIPLEGNSSPVVWDKRIFVSGAAEDRQTIFCFDAETGKLLWSGDVAVSDAAARAEMSIMEDTGYAACSPAADGRRVCAIFAGGDIGCFTAEGRLLWQKPLGIPESMYGYAASLTAFENLVIVQWDVGSETDQSRLIALDWQTGETVWQTPRPVPNSWSSPTVVKIGDAYRILTAASPFVIAYDAKTGSEVFRAECIEGDIAATPIIADGKIITMQPYQKLVAIRTEGAVGDVTATHIAWQTDGAMPDICSPLSDGTFAWTLTSDGKLGCYKVSDGSEVYAQTLKGMFQASPSLACGRLYLLGQDGTMIVAEAAGEYKEISRSALREKCFASPAFAEGRIYIRTKQHLYGIGTK
jgi:outer membrane protein assembly factor BamB